MYKLIMDHKDFLQTVAALAQATIPIVIGVVSFLYYKMVTEQKLNEGDAASIVHERFWSVREPKILAVHKYIKSDDVSGYNHVSQNSRPDQWSTLIEVKKSFCIFREVRRKNPDDILRVIISRNGREKWRSIHFD